MFGKEKMSIENVDFDEAKQSQLPAVELLCKLGYEYISRKQALELRGGDDSKYLLGEVLRRSLMRINSYDYAGEDRKFSQVDIDTVADELENHELNGIIDTSKEITDKIMPKLGGTSIEISYDGTRESRSVRFFDFDNIKNNEFHVTVEYRVAAKGVIRPDIVCFVNGIPLVIIENKKSSVGYQEAIKQLARYQENQFAPKLFIYAQLLLAMDSVNAVYGTSGTPAKFFTSWREKGLSDEEYRQSLNRILSKEINPDVWNNIIGDLNSCSDYNQNTGRPIKDQDLVIYGLLRPERLFDIMREFVFYDGVYKKVARYQQYFAVKKILDAVKIVNGDRRKGGIIWHTQGSGKSLTMVMLVRALIDDESIISPRVLIVTDRIDLDKQIKETFNNGGLKKEIIQMKSGQDLLDNLSNKNPAVLTTLVHKFESAGKKKTNFVDNDKNIFVLIDEAHRSQGGEANMEMLKCLPNACVIGFTGTPHLKKDKSRKKFGDFIDRYTIDDALKDKIILPLLYEPRFVDVYQDKEQVDKGFGRVEESTDSEMIERAKKKMNKKILAANPSVIEEICDDVKRDFVKNFQNTGLKAQLVAPSKYAGLLMQKYFEKYTNIKTALIISDENGEIDEEDFKRKEIVDYLSKVKQNYSSLKSYEESIIDDFVNNPDGTEIIIVVDKLLTGFDAPCNTVLYLAKQLRDHNLLQAIARVNRLHDNPKYPKTTGYIIDYSKNAENIGYAMELFSDFDPDDIKRALMNVDDKIHELGQKHSEVVDLFKGFDGDNQIINLLRQEPKRKMFVEKYNEFLKTYNEVSNLRDFIEKIDANKLDTYKLDLKKFANIKKTAALQYGDMIDLKQYQRELENVLDKNIHARTAEVIGSRVEISNTELMKMEIENIGSDKAKAEAIAAQTKRVINDYKDQDNALYKKFSDLIDAIMKDIKEGRIADIEALNKLRNVSQEAENRQDSSVPNKIAKIRGADVLYRNIKDILPIKDDKKYINVILEIVNIINHSATVDWWKSFESKRQMRSNVDDFLYDFIKENNLAYNNDQIINMADEIVKIAEYNHEYYGRK